MDDSLDVTERRRQAAVAGHTGDGALARSFLTDAAPSVRATALGALSRLGVLTSEELRAGLADAASSVRRRAAAEARHRPEIDLVPLLADDDPLVAEVAAWALGERADVGAVGAAAVARLVATVETHPDPLVREAAVAALGAIGDEAGLPAILRATSDKPAVRRRAVLALAPFDGTEVDAALQRALTDRDWQVRQAAEDLLTD